MNVFGFARRHARRVTRIGGEMLVSRAWTIAMTWLRVHWIGGF
jgi:hypothetical protein